MKNKSAGFTLIELVIVIVILGILAATALPRFVDMTGEAHTAAVKGTGGGFTSSVTLAHALFLAKGMSGAGNIDMSGQTVGMNSSGWPVGGSGQTAVSVANCQALWNGIMQNPPSVSGGAGADYTATSAGTQCVYTYNGATSPARSITYDSANGSVTVVSE